MPLVWLALPNWLPDDPKSWSGEYERKPSPAKRAETWSGGCERSPGPANVSGVLGPTSTTRMEIELAFREVVLTTVPNKVGVNLNFGFEQLRPYGLSLYFIYSHMMLQNYNRGPFCSESKCGFAT